MLSRMHPKDAKPIDLGRATVLPGLIDCHIHIMARIEIPMTATFSPWRRNRKHFRALEGRSMQGLL
jgi:imidazolonepropionase-like amidohydrolase